MMKGQKHEVSDTTVAFQTLFSLVMIPLLFVNDTVSVILSPFILANNSSREKLTL